MISRNRGFRNRVRAFLKSVHLQSFGNCHSVPQSRTPPLVNRESRLQNGAIQRTNEYYIKQRSEFANECSRLAVFITEKEDHMNIRNEIKAQIIRAGFTMQEVVDLLADQYGWSDSVSNLSAKLQRESIRGEGLFYRSIAVHRAASAKRNDFLCRGTHG